MGTLDIHAACLSEQASADNESMRPLDIAVIYIKIE